LTKAGFDPVDIELKVGSVNPCTITALLNPNNNIPSKNQKPKTSILEFLQAT
jgi:hypothetical protein